MSVYRSETDIRTVNGISQVERATATLPQTTTVDLFSIDGGRVRILEIIGEVTTVIQTQANNTKLTFDPDSGGADVDICAVLDISADAVGALYGITGDFSDALAGGIAALESDALMEKDGIILPEGDIKLNCAASSTGAIAWTIQYQVIDPGASVSAV